MGMSSFLQIWSFRILLMLLLPFMSTSLQIIMLLRLPFNIIILVLIMS